MSIIALKNLLLQELREFSSALEKETFQQLQERKDRISQIDIELAKRKTLSKAQKV